MVLTKYHIYNKPLEMHMFLTCRMAGIQKATTLFLGIDISISTDLRKLYHCSVKCSGARQCVLYVRVRHMTMCLACMGFIIYQTAQLKHNYYMTSSGHMIKRAHTSLELKVRFSFFKTKEKRLEYYS